MSKLQVAHPKFQQIQDLRSDCYCCAICFLRSLQFNMQLCSFRENQYWGFCHLSKIKHEKPLFSQESKESKEKNVYC